MPGRKLNASTAEAQEMKGTIRRMFSECKVGTSTEILYSQVPISGKRLTIVESKIFQKSDDNIA